MSRDIVHAQCGFRRRFCGDFVNRFTGGETLPMDWLEDMQLPTGNEIRFADEILPDGQDEIPAVDGDEIRPSVGLGQLSPEPLPQFYSVASGNTMYEVGGTK
ncbi:MAG: hypothetical protein IKV13_04465 [Akkermansia sp.]|nr:hypothetical protein [Akkermansia sp.]